MRTPARFASIARPGPIPRVLDLIFGHEIGADRRKGVPRLHLKEHVIWRRQAARRAVDEIDVAEHVIHGLGGPHVPGPLADYDAELRLALEHARRRVGQTIVSPGPMMADGDLWKALMGAGSVRVPSSM
jgi:hypothetical protein